MGKSLIKLIKKPKKPVRKVVAKRLEVHTGVTLAEVVEYFEGCDFSQVEATLVYGYGEGDDIDFTCCHPQTDEELETDMGIFRIAKERYDTWYAANSELIDREVQRRKDVAKVRKDKYNLAEKIRLQNRILKLNKRLRDAEKGRHS